ncbi:MAG: hypothetical protein M1828_006177 [Chrysothrix sp. TS-e1954]|nr:MAG: hypothetical protein M1828_006177 [Chrysothrix sp. TS-e1954]
MAPRAPRTPLPRHHVHARAFGRHDYSVNLKRNGKRFEAALVRADVQDSVIPRRYRQINSARDLNAEELRAAEEWLVRPCRRQLIDLAPRPADEDFMLEHVYRPEQIFLRLGSNGSRLTVTHLTQYSGLPRYDLTIAIRSTYLDDMTKRLPRFKAIDIELVPDPEDPDGHLFRGPPRQVRTADGQLHFFKPATSPTQMVREPRIYAELRRKGLADMPNISRLNGLVISGNGYYTAGMLIEWIDMVGDLRDRVCLQATQHHRKWMNQVRQVVTTLHDNGLVWGDVHPGNVVIDQNWDAVVVDFGGGYLRPFLTNRECNTVEGDEAGMHRLFRHLRGTTITMANR